VKGGEIIGIEGKGKKRKFKWNFERGKKKKQGAGTRHSGETISLLATKKKSGGRKKGGSHFGGPRERGTLLCQGNKTPVGQIQKQESRKTLGFLPDSGGVEKNWETSVSGRGGETFRKESTTWLEGTSNPGGEKKTATSLFTPMKAGTLFLRTETFLTAETGGGE